jgi:hypothetical protein
VIESIWECGVWYIDLRDVWVFYVARYMRTLGLHFSLNTRPTFSDSTAFSATDMSDVRPKSSINLRCYIRPRWSLGPPKDRFIRTEIADKVR